MILSYATEPVTITLILCSKFQVPGSKFQLGPKLGTWNLELGTFVWRAMYPCLRDDSSNQAGRRKIESGVVHAYTLGREALATVMRYLVGVALLYLYVAARGYGKVYAG